MCDSGTTISTAGSTAGGAFAVPVDMGAYAGEQIPLEPVERVRITTLVDNVSDLLAADTGPARRRPLARWPWRDAPTTVEGRVPDGPRAEHGFSALVEVTRVGGPVHRLLFDTGVTPDGMVENMRRMDLAPGRRRGRGPAPDRRRGDPLRMGGFHLTGGLFEPIIPATVEALAGLAPDVVVPAHCTGWKAAAALAARLPDAFIQNTVGTTFDLAAA